MLLLRADMDALPVTEDSEADYRSRNDGFMHACGHDGHTAIALVAAERLRRDPPPGRVRFAFQPAEEIGEGADAMIADGVLEGVDAAIGLHLWNDTPVGVVGVTDGPVMAAVDDFEIVVEGEGGHAAMPHQAKDPVVAAAELVLGLQSIVSRGVDPFETAVLSVTRIRGGEATNIIPERVELSGTIRTFSEDVRSFVHQEIASRTKGVGRARIRPFTNALVNDPRMGDVVRVAAREVVGAENVIHGVRTTGGEDFASFASRVPAFFYFVGSGPDGGGAPHHNPRFDIDERSLGIGLEILTRAAHGWFAGHSA